MTQSQPGAREALQELVALKDLKDRVERSWPGDPEIPTLLREYSSRKDAAWAAARAALSSPEVPANGPGTPAYRFDRLMGELQKRFPDPEPWSASAPEPRILAVIDARLAEVPASTEAQKDGRDTGLLVATDAVGSFIGVDFLGNAKPVGDLADAQFIDGSDATEKDVAEVAAKGVTLHRIVLFPVAAAPKKEAAPQTDKE